MTSDAGSWPNGIKLSSKTSLTEKSRASHGDQVAVSQIGSALNGAGCAIVRSQWQEVPPRYTDTLNTVDTRGYGYLHAIRLLARFDPAGEVTAS